MAEQLALSVRLRDDATFDNFFVGDNALTVEALTAALRGDGEQFFFIWGLTGTGRTHLLQACCHAMDKLKQQSFYLTLNEHSLYQPEILAGLDSLALVAIDDIDAIAGDAKWEEALFHLYNRCRESGTILCITAHDAPRYLTVTLPDLQSRLAWGLVCQLHGLPDQQKVQVLQQRAKSRGMLMSDEVANFLMNRCERDMPNLFVILDRLDHATLAAQRRLTIPFIKSVLSV